jgi:hypothetical protein
VCVCVRVCVRVRVRVRVPIRVRECVRVFCQGPSLRRSYKRCLKKGAPPEHIIQYVLGVLVIELAFFFFLSFCRMCVRMSRFLLLVFVLVGVS